MNGCPCSWQSDLRRSVGLPFRWRMTQQRMRRIVNSVARLPEFERGPNDLENRVLGNVELGLMSRGELGSRV
ncbi:hypothetical protein BDZ89DRAFT_538388 [Hymenopellis radicata]|nr:hypothetical protein BDZ89DRAFT_538388 [Hymenopellis radicata]